MLRIWSVCFTFMLVSARLYFNTQMPDDGAFNEYPHDKSGQQEIPEDSFKTSPIAIAVCDGVGGSLISSKFISEVICLEHMKLHFDLFTKNKAYNLAEYTKTAQTYYDTVLKANQILIEKSLYAGAKALNYEAPPGTEFSVASTTMMGVALFESGAKTMIVSHQKGDSLMLAFKLVEQPKGNLYYVPKMFLAEKQFSFNFPWQFGTFSDLTTSKNQAPEENSIKELEGAHNDLIVIGSDGVFDNIYNGFLTMAVNFMLAQPETSRSAQFHKIRPYVEIFRRILEAKLWVRIANTKHDQTITLQQENDLRYSEHFFEKLKEKSKKTAKEEKAKPFDKFIEEDFKKAYGGKPEVKFSDKLNEWIKELVPSTANAKEKAGWTAYFTCSMTDMMSEPEHPNDEPNVLKDCVKTVIEKNFGTNEAGVALFTRSQRNTLHAGYIADIASYFSSFKKYYPSPFTSRGWRDKEKDAGTGTGKSDDITAIAVTLKEAQKPSSDFMTLMMSWFDGQDAIWKAKYAPNMKKVVELNILNWWKDYVEGTCSTNMEGLMPTFKKDQVYIDIAKNYMKSGIDKLATKEEGITKKDELIEEAKSLISSKMNEPMSAFCKKRTDEVLLKIDTLVKFEQTKRDTLKENLKASLVENTDYYVDWAAGDLALLYYTEAMNSKWPGSVVEKERIL